MGSASPSSDSGIVTGDGANDGSGAPKTTAATATAARATAAGSQSQSFRVRPSLIEQAIRALLHMLQFAVAYFVMLLAMYFNGYIIICIFIGAFLGSFIFSWEHLGGGTKEYVSFSMPFDFGSTIKLR